MTKIKYIIILEIIVFILTVIGRFSLSTMILLSHQRFSFDYSYLKRLEAVNYNLRVKLDQKMALNRLTDWALKSGFARINDYTVLAPAVDDVKLTLSIPSGR